jgi:hypothetical protein
MNERFEEALRCQADSGSTPGTTTLSTRSTKSAATPVSDAAIQDLWPEFAATVRGRLQVGAQAYGDTSFDLPADRLAEEIEQELDDVMGWGFILWCRMRRLRAMMARLESMCAEGCARGTLVDRCQ